MTNLTLESTALSAGTETHDSLVHEDLLQWSLWTLRKTYQRLGPTEVYSALVNVEDVIINVIDQDPIS